MYLLLIIVFHGCYQLCVLWIIAIKLNVCYCVVDSFTKHVMG